MSMYACIYVYFVFGVAGGFCCSPFDRSDICPLLGVGGGCSRLGVGGGGGCSRLGVGGGCGCSRLGVGGGWSLFGGVSGGGSYWVPTEGLCSCWKCS